MSTYFCLISLYERQGQQVLVYIHFNLEMNRL